MKPIDRVKEIVKHKNLSVSAFEKITGMSNNSIQTAIKKGANLKDSTLISILNAYPEINPEWLLTGRGEMFRDGKTPPPVQPIKISPLFKRLTQIAENKGFKSVNDFALNGLGYESAEKLTRLKKEENKPSYNTMMDILGKFPDISQEWLLTGEGEMLKICQRTFLDSQNSIEDAILNKVKEKLLPEIQSQIEELKALINKSSS